MFFCFITQFLLRYRNLDSERHCRIRWQSGLGCQFTCPYSSLMNKMLLELLQMAPMMLEENPVRQKCHLVWNLHLFLIKNLQERILYQSIFSLQLEHAISHQFVRELHKVFWKWCTANYKSACINSRFHLRPQGVPSREAGRVCLGGWPAEVTNSAGGRLQMSPGTSPNQVEMPTRKEGPKV